MSTTTSPAEVTATTRLPHRRTRALAVAAATVAALTVWTIARPLAGAALTVNTGSGTQHVGPAAVVIASIVIGLAGWALLATLEKLTPRTARTAWTVTALAVLLLSLTAPITSGITAGTATTLASMHVAVAAVLIPLLTRSARR